MPAPSRKYHHSTSIRREPIFLLYLKGDPSFPHIERKKPGITIIRMNACILEEISPFRFDQEGTDFSITTCGRTKFYTNQFKKSGIYEIRMNACIFEKISPFRFDLEGTDFPITSCGRTKFCTNHMKNRRIY
jgi:hypothetical protein